jgi:hypothetical protein
VALLKPFVLLVEAFKVINLKDVTDPRRPLMISYTATTHVH